jgi:hypothetical protein
MENFWLCRSFGGQRAFRDLQRWRLRQKRFSIPRRRRSQMIPIPAVVAIIVVLYVLSAIKVLREYERGVIFRLGRLLPYAKGPGIILVFAPVDRMARISLRQEALDILAHYQAPGKSLRPSAVAHPYFVSRRHSICQPNLGLLPYLLIQFFHQAFS